MPGERIPQNRLARAVRLVRVVRFATSCGASQKPPIGRLVASPWKALGVHEALQVIQRMRVDLFPVSAQPLGHAT